MFMVRTRLETINDTIQSLKSLGLEIPEQLLYEQLQEEEKEIEKIISKAIKSVKDSAEAILTGIEHVVDISVHYEKGKGVSVSHSVAKKTTLQQKLASAVNSQKEAKEREMRISFYKDARVAPNKRVRLWDRKTSKEFEYTLVAGQNTNLRNGEISTASPIGRSLLDHKVGDIIEIRVPAGVQRLEILAIE